MKSTLSQDALKAAQAVNQDRLWQSLMELAKFGGRDDGGVCRHALSEQDIAARDVVIKWAQARGFEVSVDKAANLFIRRSGRDVNAAPVLTGSHMDSQPAGGKFDGAWGVLAGFEALIALEDANITTKRPIDVVAWTNEEGGRFARSCTGSSIWSGAKRLSDYEDDIAIDGVTMREALACTLAATPDLTRRDFNWNAHAYIECHIEQGPVLQAEGLDIAAVSSIQGVRWMNVEVFGKGCHAGTTPLAGRHDAMQAMIRAVTDLNILMHDPDDIIRFTIGRVQVEPNSPNTVPEKATFTIDFRHPDATVLKDKTAQIESIIAKAVAPCSFAVTRTTMMEPVAFPENLVDQIEHTARGLGLRVRNLPSGAFHDALYVQKKCPASMIFIPCRDGLSHHPDEWAEPHHCASGTKVLTASLVELAND